MRKKRSYKAFPEPKTINYSLSTQDGLEKFTQHFNAAFSAEGSLKEYEICATTILSKAGIVWDGTEAGAIAIIKRQPKRSLPREAAELLFRLCLCRNSVKTANCEDAVWNAILMMEFYNNIVLLTLEYEVGLARHLIASARTGTDVAYGTPEVRKQKSNQRKDFIIALQEEHPDWTITKLIEFTANHYQVSISTIKRSYLELRKQRKKTSD